MTRHRLPTLLILIAGWIAVEARAADPATSARIERRYQAGAVELLSRFLKPRDFTVSVDVVAKDLTGAAPGGSIGYMPRSAQTQLIESVEFRELRAMATRVSIEIALDARYDQKSQARFGQLITKALRLDPAAGDAVTFASLDIARPDDEAALAAAAPKAEQAQAKDMSGEVARQAAQLEVIRGQLDDARRKLTVAESSKAAADASTKALQEQLDRSKQMSSGGGGEKDGDASSETKPGAVNGPAEDGAFERWATPLIAFLATIAVLVVGFGLVNAFRKIGGDLGAGLDSIGKGVAVSASVASQQAAGAAPEEKKSSPVGLPTPGAGGESTDGLGPVYARLSELHVEVIGLLTNHTEILVLRWVTALLQDEATTAKAVVTLELFGADKANELYRKLGTVEQSSVLKFMRLGVSSGSKAKLMLEAGEDLKTRLMALGNDGLDDELTRQLHVELLKVSDVDLGKSLANMKDASLARLLMHLEPMRTARLLNLVATENKDQYTRLTRQLSYIADAVLRVELDKEILDALRLAQGSADASNRKFFISYYKELLDGVGEDIGDQIVQNLSSDPMLKERVVKHHITVNQFFGMDGELRGEILQTLGGKDVAAWASTLADGQRNVVLGGLGDKRREIVTDEMRQILGSKALQRKARRSAQVVRGRIVTAMRELRESGEWQAATAALPAPDNASSGGSMSGNGGQDAA